MSRVGSQSDRHCVLQAGGKQPIGDTADLSSIGFYQYAVSHVKAVRWTISSVRKCSFSPDYCTNNTAYQLPNLIMFRMCENVTRQLAGSFQSNPVGSDSSGQKEKAKCL